jgi:tetratricopeptide (TPR) repeat protein
MRGPHDPPLSKPLFALAIASLVVVAAGCDGCGDRKTKPVTTKATSSAKAGPDAGSSAQTDGSASKPLRLKPRSMDELPTTAADIYFGNLDGQIEEITRLLKEQVAPPVSHLRLASSLHYTRGRFRGDLGEIALAIEILDKCTKLDPAGADCFVMRADQEQSLHRFKETRADIERAKKLGIDAARVVDLETELEWNAGNYDVAIKAIRDARLKRPSVGAWMREAQLEHDLGNDDKVDAAFEAAEDMIVDTNPLPVAHLNVQRGIVKAHAGRLDDAIVFFREAVARIPDYVAANEHLAEALHQLGKDDEATKIYEAIVERSDDPEFMHALASLYKAHGKPDKARELDARATSRYEVLLKTYPEAMYWHASEFYLDTGNAAKAVELLRKNIVLRPNSHSFTALANAELANKQAPDAKASIDKALAMPLRSADLFFTASKVHAATGDAASSATYLARAKALNPRIDRP